MEPGEWGHEAGPESTQHHGPPHIVAAYRKPDGQDDQHKHYNHCHRPPLGNVEDSFHDGPERLGTRVGVDPDPGGVFDGPSPEAVGVRHEEPTDNHGEQERANGGGHGPPSAFDDEDDNEKRWCEF